jgi:hypothetical protein
MKKNNTKLPALPALPGRAIKPIPQKNAGIAKPSSGSNKVKSITFGRFPHSTTKTSAPGTQWSSLLKKAKAGNVAGALSNVADLGGGIGALFSRIESLFGSSDKSNLPELTAYQLPASQQINLSTGSVDLRPASYGGATLFESQSAHIIRTVRQALLNSSALNDVISEI